MTVMLAQLIVVQKCHEKPLPPRKHRYLAHVGTGYFCRWFYFKGIVIQKEGNYLVCHVFLPA